jgi:tetratricopeptide (TPR) repeat protein
MQNNALTISEHTKFILFCSHHTENTVKNHPAHRVIVVRLPHYENSTRTVFDSISEGKGISLEARKKMSQEIIDRYPDSLDAIMSRLSILGLMLAEGKLPQIKEEIDNIELTGDPYVDYFIYDLKTAFYYGFNDPSVDFDKSEEYRAQTLQKFKEITFQSEFEEIWINIMEYRNQLNRTRDKNQILQILKDLEAEAQKYDNKGLYIAIANDTANSYRQIGMIDKAIELYELSIQYTKEMAYSMMPYSNLAYTYFLSNDMKMAQETLDQAKSVFEQHDDLWLKQQILQIQRLVAEMLHDFDRAEEVIHQEISLSESAGEYYWIFRSHLGHFMFHYRQHGHHSRQNSLDKASEVLDTLQDIQKQHPQDELVENLALYAEALMLKTGIMRQRVRAVEILEELIPKFPNRSDMKTDLISLYWSDMEYDSTGEVKDRIDSLMDELVNLPTMEGDHINYQNYPVKILVAHYDYYIQGNPNGALQQLHTYADATKKSGFAHLNTLIGIEIKKMENELSKWQDIDMSVKQRATRSKFADYITEARNFMES